MYSIDLLLNFSAASNFLKILSDYLDSEKLYTRSDIVFAYSGSQRRNTATIDNLNLILWLIEGKSH